jgi:RNA polymerase sigma-70 factor (ECF subfamily)
LPLGLGTIVLTDAVLVEKVLNGEDSFYRMLVERYEKQVYSLGMSFFHNPGDSEDFTQEVFVKAFRSLGQFEGRSRFSTWLYRIAYNSAINKAQRRTEYAGLAENAEAVFGLTPEEESVRAAVREAVREAVNDLPEKYRVCIDLFFFYDCSYYEISTITGDPVNTIKSHIFRAKKILREKLRDVR